MEYKYFDTIDEEYIQFFSQKFPSSLEDLERIKNAKIEKYKDIDLGSLYKIHFEPAVLYDIYMKIVRQLGFKDPILLYKWNVENYDHGIGIKTPDQVKQFYKELSCILDKDYVEDLDDFNQYVDNVFPKVINNTNEPTKTQEVVSDDRINSETNNKQVNKQKKEPPKVEIDVEACVGSYDEKQTEKLYGECNNVVFKYCKIEDFVNSLNNPDECNLEVKNKSLLYVLYTYFFNFFGDKDEEKRNQLNTKFEITISDYQKHKYSNKTASGKQKEFNESLARI